MIRKLILFSHFLFFSIACLAVTDTLIFNEKHYTDEDGLPQNSVKAIAKDIHGFIWLTTEDGLVRFDGRHFLNFSKLNTGLSSSRFGSILPDWNNNTFYANNEKAEFLQIEHGTARASVGYVKMQEDALNFIPGIPDRKRFEHRGFPDRARDLIMMGDTCIIMHGNNMVTVFDKRNVSVFQNKKLLYSIHFDGSDDSRFFLVKDQLYYLNDNGRITAFGPGGASDIEITGDLEKLLPLRIKPAQVKIFWNINSRNNVVFYYNHCFYVLKRSSDGNMQSSLLVDKFDANKNEVLTAYYDEQEKNLFLGSLVNGLYLFSRPLFTIVLSDKSDMDNVYYGQTLFNRDYMLSAQGHLLNVDSPYKLAVHAKRFTHSDKYSILEDQNGYIWTKNADTIFKLSPRNFMVEGQWQVPSSIKTLFQGTNGRLWIGMMNGQLMQMDQNDPKTVPLPVIKLSSPINCIDQQGDSIIWAGTSQGLFRIDNFIGSVKSIAGLENTKVRSIYRPIADQLWVTTYENGFFLYTPQRLTRFPVDKNHFLLTAHCLIEDDKGFFWITTNKGLFQASKMDLLAYADDSLKSIYYQYYSKNEGLLTNEFNGGCQPCAIRLPNRWYSLPTINGLVWFDPNNLKPKLPNKDLFIDNMLVDNQSVDISGIIQLPRNLQQLKIYISTPYWGNHNNISIQYALVRDGSEPVWLTLDNNNLISLSTLSTGNYLLRIRKINGFGQDSHTEKVIRLTVPVHWVQHPFVMVSGFFLVVFLIHLFVQARTRYIQQKNSMLEKRIADKTEKLSTALVKLEFSQEELIQHTELQKKLLASFSHDIKAPMKYLMLTAEKIYQGLRSENNSSFIQPSKTVNDYTRRLYYLMENLLQYIKTHLTEKKISYDDFDLYELVKEKMIIYEDIAMQAQTRLENNLAPGFRVVSNKILLSVILHNLLDNAIKVTEMGKVAVSASKDELNTRITITDTGIGIKEELLAWVNDADAIRLIKERRSHYTESGIGLYIVKDLSVLLGIQLHAETVDKETRFTLSFKNQEVYERPG